MNGDPTRSSRAKNSLLLFSSCEHSLGNKGDMSMLVGTLNWLRERYPHLHLVVYATEPRAFESVPDLGAVEIKPSPELYFFPSKDRSLPARALMRLLPRIAALLQGLWFCSNFLVFKRLGASCIRNQAACSFFQDIQSARALVLVGGGYLNSLWWLNGIFGKAVSALVAKLAAVPVILSGQGIGPISHGFDRLALGMLCRIADQIGVRETRSTQVLQSLYGEEALTIVHTWDDALTLPESDTGTLKLPLPEVATGTQFIGINLRDASSYGKYQRQDIDKLAQILDRVLETGNRHLVFIPISYNSGDDDRAAARRIVAAMQQGRCTSIINQEQGPASIKAMIARMTTVIGISYHFNLFALSQNIPAIGLYDNEYYQHKLSGLFSIYGLEENCLGLGDKEPDEISTFINSVLSRTDSFRQRLSTVNREVNAEVEASRRRLFDVHLR